MSDSEDRDARVSRLLALASRARELGIEAYARALTKLAADTTAEATENKGRDRERRQ
jgi:hypothetical protein